ncbi:MAG: hypothetical protein QNJ71_11190 [Acidimicrobiia bacterium]|nr:hypothetical protein [Acidimicrobiia bacterium]
MFDRSEAPEQVDRVRDRLPDFAVLFVIGLVAAAGSGVLIATVTAADLWPAVAAGLIVLGVVCLLSAGLTGGSYAVGGVGKGAARYTFRFGDGNEGLVQEWRDGYRPPKDTTAFLQVIAGAGYMAIGAVLLATMT